MAARSGFSRERDGPGSGLGKVSRDAPGLSGRKRMVSLGKLAVPKPLQLPSQKKENAGNDPTAQLVPPGTAGWAKGEGSEHDIGSSIVDKATWASSGGSGCKMAAGDEVALPPPVTRPLPWEQPVARPLNPSEFPSLEAAKHGQPAQATTHLAADATGSWEEDERRSGMGPQRNWNERGRGDFGHRPPPSSYGAHQEPQDWRCSQPDRGNLLSPNYYAHEREEPQSAYVRMQPVRGRYAGRERSYGYQESALLHERERGGLPSSSGRYSSGGGSHDDGPPARFSRYDGMDDRGLPPRHNWHHEDKLAPRSCNRERHDSYRQPQHGSWGSAEPLTDDTDLFPPPLPEVPHTALESAPRDDERDAFNAEVERLAAEMAAGRGRLAGAVAVVPEPPPVPRTAWQQPTVELTAEERLVPPLRPELPPRWEEPATARSGLPEHEAGHHSEPAGYQQGKTAPALLPRGPPVDAAPPPGSSLRSNGVYGRPGLPTGLPWRGLPPGRHGSGDFRRDAGPPLPVEPELEPPPVAIVRRQQPQAQASDNEPRSGLPGETELPPPPSEPLRVPSASSASASAPSPEQQQQQQQQRQRQQAEPRPVPCARPAAPPPPPPRYAVVPGVSFKSLVSGVPDEAPADKAGMGRKAKAKPAKSGKEGEAVGTEPGKKGGKVKTTKQLAEGGTAASMGQQQQQPSTTGEAGKIRRQQRQERQLVQAQDADGGRPPRAENSKGRRVKGHDTACAATEQQQQATKEKQQQQQQQEQSSSNPTVAVEAAHPPSAAKVAVPVTVEHVASPEELGHAVVAKPAAKPVTSGAPMFGWRSQLADMQVGPAPAPLPLTGPGPEEGVAALQLPPTLDHEMAESEGGSAGGLRDVITALPADLNLDIAGPLSPAPPPATTTVSGSFGLPPPRTAASPPPFPGGLFPMPAGSTWQPQAPPQEAMALFYGAQPPPQEGQQLLAFSGSGTGMPFGPVAAAFGQGEVAAGFMPTSRQPDWGAFLGAPASQPQLFGSIAPAGVFPASVDVPLPMPPGLTASPGTHLESLLPDDVFGDAQAPEQGEMRMEQQQRHEPGTRGYRGRGRRGRGSSSQLGACGPPPPPGLEMHGPGGDGRIRGGRGQRGGGGRQRRGPKPPGSSPGM